MRQFGLAVRVVLLTLGTILLATFAQAQYRASIQGVVTDQQGAVVPGASVSLKNLETGLVVTDLSDEKGIFNFSGLPPAKFSLTVEKTGFKKKVVESFGINAEQANALNVQLEIGQATESITVNGDAAPLLDTESANVGGEVKAQDYQKMASFGRDPFQLLQLVSGAFGDGARGNGANGGFNLPGTTVGGTSGTDGIFKIENGGQVTANGARTGENNYQIDGVSTTSVTWGGTSVVTPNEDSVKEVKVITDNYDAENGRYRGAQVQVISQNGTNQYHGSAFFRAHRPGLNAFTRYNGYSNSNVRDTDRYNDYGATVGGPIIHNRLFGFFSYETLVNNAAAGVGQGAWYETPDYRALAKSGTNAAAFYAFPGMGGPYGGTQVDHDCTFIGLSEGVDCHFIAGKGLNLGRPLTIGQGVPDPTYQKCVNIVPGSNPPKCATGSPLTYGTGGDGLLTYNPVTGMSDGGAHNLDPTTADIAFYTNPIAPSTSTHRQYNGRVDFNATSKDLVAFSFYYVPNTSTGINGNGDRRANLFNSSYHNRAATAIWDHTFGATMANEVRVNAAGWLQKDLDQNPSGPWGLPQVSFNGLGGITVQGYGIGSFNGFDQWTYAGKDVLTKVHGAHTMKMGGEFTRLLSVDAPFWSDRPGYTFNNIWDFLNDAPISENGQFDPQTGVPSAFRKDLRSDVIAFFFQDNYKASPTLTLTAGLRWEYFGPVSEIKGHLATVVLGQGANEFTGLSVRTGGNQYTAQKTNFGPQLGFAWSPRDLAGHDFGSKLVIRGGFGMAYNGITQANTLDTRFNPPFSYNAPSLCNINVTGCQASNALTYEGTFPSNVHSPNGYASNKNAIAHFGSNNLPVDPVTGAPTCCVDLTALPANFPTTYSYHYTLGGEYDLGNQWVASVGYQGSTTRHLTQHYNLYNVGAAHNLPLNPYVHGIAYYADDGSARFNALLLEVKHAFGQSFTLDTQYRLSKSLDTGSNAYSNSSGFYQWDLGTELGPSDYDVRHAFKIYGVWSPTIFRGSRNWMERIVGGWSLSGILNAHTGFPWTPRYSVGELNSGFDPVFNFGQNSGGSSSDAGNGSVLPAAYLGGFKADFPGTGNLDGKAFFAPPVIPQGTLFTCLFPNPPIASCPNGQQPFGGLPSRPGIVRNSFTGPGYFNLDATLSKAFGLPPMKVLGEGAKLEIRANFYNLFNKLNMNGSCGWNGVQCDIGQPHFGESQTSLGARVIEMQARFNF